MKPNVSIIVPVYKVEKYIKRCLDSIIKQSLENIEIILIDDGSPDKCGEICEKYKSDDRRIKVIHKRNAGLGYARNSGIEAATGEFIAFVDSDDYVSHNMYERLYMEAKRHNADIVFCDFYERNKNKYKLIKDEGETIIKGSRGINKFMLEMIGAAPSYKKDYKHAMMVWHGIYSKSIIDKYNIRFCSERQFISEDILFHVDLLPKVNVICKINKPLYFYCYNEKSLSRQYSDARFIRDLNLYHEINSRLNDIFDYKIYHIYTDRLLIARVRTNIMHIVRSSKKDDKKKRRERISKIINDEEVIKVINSYPVNKLPVTHKIFAEAVREHRCNRIIILAELRKMLSNIVN